MKKITAASLMLSILLFAGAARAAQPAPKKFTPVEPIMPVSQIKPGMKAKVKTVLEGTKIYQFDATLLGIVPGKSTPKNLILIRVDDKYVRDSGGIAAGMSGSPVYVEGRLVGAIGYGWPFGDPNLGLVTPIEEMVKVFEWPDKIPTLDPAKLLPELEEKGKDPAEYLSRDILSADNSEKNGDAASDDADYDDIFPEAEEDEEDSVSIDVEELIKSISDDLSADIGEKDEETEALLPDGIRENIAKLYDMELTPLAMPLLVDGISPRMTERLKRGLGMEVLPLGASSPGVAVNLKASPKPGAALGALLAWGDFQVGGIGTLTAVDKEGRFLAFAHQMANKGAVSYVATEANIIKVIPSVATPFKLGYHGEIVGIVTQDRPSAIGGRLGRLAPAVGYTVKFHDVDTGKKVTKRFQTVADPFIGPAVGTTGMLGIIDDLWGRAGEGTAILRYKFSGGGLAHGWTRSNIYLSDTDVVAEMTSEFDDLSKIFALNQFREISPFGVELEIEITRDIRGVSIEKLEIVGEKAVYMPGDTVDLEITLRPWRKHAVKKRLSLKVPENAVGFCEIVVRGGGIDELSQESILAGFRAISGFEGLIKELNAVESNNQLILEIKSDGDLFAPRKNKKTDDPEGGKEAKASEAAKEGKGRERDTPSAEDFFDDRLKSEIVEERLAEGTMKIIDTNYYVDGLLRKPLTIGGKSKRSAFLQAIFGGSPSDGELPDKGKAEPENAPEDEEETPVSLLGGMMFKTR